MNVANLDDGVSDKVVLKTFVCVLRIAVTD